MFCFTRDFQEESAAYKARVIWSVHHTVLYYMIAEILQSYENLTVLALWADPKSLNKLTSVYKQQLLFAGSSLSKYISIRL